jgi:hypothetical protein
MKLSGIISITAPALLALAVSLSAGEPNPSTSAGKKDAPRVDAIFNEMMETASPEMRAEIDSSRASGMVSKNKVRIIGNDSASVRLSQEKKQKDVHRKLQELPEEVRVQTEHAIREMEKRQEEREFEFKEMKRGGGR